MRFLNCFYYTNLLTRGIYQCSMEAFHHFWLDWFEHTYNIIIIYYIFMSKHQISAVKYFKSYKKYWKWIFFRNVDKLCFELRNHKMLIYLVILFEYKKKIGRYNIIIVACGINIMYQWRHEHIFWGKLSETVLHGCA